MSVEIVLDPQGTPAVVIDPPSAPSVTVTTTGVVVVPGGFKVYTSWAEVDAETESTIGVLTTDDWAPAGLTNDGPSRDAAFFITTQAQTVATGWAAAGVWRRQELRMWDAVPNAPIWRVRQTSDAGGPLGEWWDVEHQDLPFALRRSLAGPEDVVAYIEDEDFDDPWAEYRVGYRYANWRTLTGFAELPDDDWVVAHVFNGGGWGNFVQTVVVPLADGTSRTITRVSTNGTSYGAWTLQPTIPDNVTISDDYVLTIGD